VVLPGPGHHGEERSSTAEDENGGDLGHAPIIGMGPEGLINLSSRVP
jgi:hypothetical protein